METRSQELLLGLLYQEEFAVYHLGESGLMKLPRWIQLRWTQPRWSQWKKDTYPCRCRPSRPADRVALQTQPEIDRTTRRIQAGNRQAKPAAPPSLQPHCSPLEQCLADVCSRSFPVFGQLGMSLCSNNSKCKMEKSAVVCLRAEK